MPLSTGFTLKFRELICAVYGSLPSFLQRVKARDGSVTVTVRLTVSPLFTVRLTWVGRKSAAMVKIKLYFLRFIRLTVWRDQRPLTGIVITTVGKIANGRSCNSFRLILI